MRNYVHQVRKSRNPSQQLHVQKLTIETLQQDVKYIYKDTRTTSCSSGVFINFKQINAGWDVTMHAYMHSLCLSTFPSQ